MTPNRIPKRVLTVLIAATATFAGYACTAFAPNTRDLITQSPENSQLLRTFSTHSDSGYSVAYTPDGQTLASAGAKTVKLWNSSTGELIRTFPGQAWAVSFSPDGQILASGSQDGNLKLWNWRTGELIRTLQHKDPVIDVVFINGQALSSGLDTGSPIKLWNWRTGEPIKIPNDPNANKLGFDEFQSEPVAFSPDGQTFFANSGSGSAIQLWNLRSGKRIRTYEAKSRINAVAISPDGKTLATGIHDNAVKLWNVRTGGLIHTLTGHAGEVVSVAYSPDGQTLTSSSWDKTIKLWNLSNGKLISTFTGHSEKVWSVAFNPDGKTFASGSQDGTINIWRLSSQ